VTLPARRRLAAWVLAVVAPVVLALALLPLRSSLGIASELFCMLLAVVLVAVIGGWRPAVLAMVAGFVLADFLYTRPHDSLQINQLVDVVALVVFAVVAVVIGALVDVLTRQGVQIARARAEATGLARLLAQRLACDTDSLPETMSALRRIFDLDSIALLRPSDAGWEIDDAVGAPVPRRPEDAHYTIELADRRLLAITGSRLQAEDAELLQALLTAVRQAREWAQAGQLASGPSDPVKR
jgi:two-component system sensor histidine kinase KdpD